MVTRRVKEATRVKVFLLLVFINTSQGAFMLFSSLFPSGFYTLKKTPDKRRYSRSPEVTQRVRLSG